MPQLLGDVSWWDEASTPLHSLAQNLCRQKTLTFNTLLTQYIISICVRSSLTCIVIQVHNLTESGLNAATCPHWALVMEINSWMHNLLMKMWYYLLFNEFRDQLLGKQRMCKTCQANNLCLSLNLCFAFVFQIKYTSICSCWFLQSCLGCI